MAHRWLQRFGLRRVVKRMQRVLHRDLGLKVDGLIEIFVPGERRTWDLACTAAGIYTSDLCPIEMYEAVEDDVTDLIGTNEAPNCDGDPAAIALRLGQVASLLAWNGLEACDEEAVEGTLPAMYGQQHNTWVVMHVRSASPQ